MTKRLRIFAGPNGSGKSTLIDILDKNLLGVYINPDEIEKQIKVNKNYFSLKNFGLKLNKNNFKQHLEQNKKFYNIDMDDVSFNDNTIYFKNDINSYVASILAAFVREELLNQGKNFTFETVMSSDDKIEFLKRAQEKGYRTYLYFIATDDPIININRVENRVKNGGHDVPIEKIKSRYYRTLDNLTKAVKYSNRAFIFDNSSDTKNFICEIEDAQKVNMKIDKVPSWFDKYFLEKLIK